MTHTFHAIPTKDAERYRNGAPDAYGAVPERKISDGGSNPCRHCLRHIPKGAEMLVLAYRPFDAPQPYAETGPIFLCAERCTRWAPSAALPPILTSETYLLRGYGPDDRIVYGSGKVTATGDIAERLEALFTDPEIRYVHLRSASNNCFQARIERDGG
ncbi:MAG: DUF1203 domain-containing protein [Pseudomonadota bacterium]